MNSKVEYSIPKEVANSANKAKKKNDNNSVSARRFFSVINDALSFFMSLRHTKRDRTEIYLWVGALIGLDLVRKVASCWNSHDIMIYLHYYDIHEFLSADIIFY